MDRKRIAEIIKDGIQFSPQIGDYVIHGAVNGIAAYIDAEVKQQNAELLAALEQAHAVICEIDFSSGRNSEMVERAMAAYENNVKLISKSKAQ